MNDVKPEDGARPAISGPPAGYFLVVPQTPEAESVSLATVLSAVAKSWLVIGSAVLIGAGAAFAASFLMPITYRAKIVVAPVSDSDAIGGRSLGAMLGSEIGGFASIAGVDLGNDARKQEFYATLQSDAFARDFIASENLMPLLFPDRWDARTRSWRPGVQVPTLEAGVRTLRSRHRVISEDRKTNLVTVAFDWTAPDIAARLANRTIEMANDRLRDVAIRQAALRVDYLTKELAKTSVVGVQQGIYQLIQEQIAKSMVANVQREYAYRVIDPAVDPDVKASPLRGLIGSVGAIAGLILSLAYVLLRGSVQAGRQ